MHRVIAKTCIGLGLLLCLTAPTALAADRCEIAWQVAQQASEKFAKDAAAGLKLFIKARQFCPDDAGLNYNLGLAYAAYGRPGEALPYLERAVKSGQATAVWRSNLATVLLQTGGDAGRALKLAREAARRESGNAEVQLTLIEALAAKGDLFEALQSAETARKKFSGNRELAALRGSLLDRYLAAALGQIKQGRTEQGLSALRRADFAGEAALMHAEVLARLQRWDEALAAVAAGRRRFAAQAGEFGRVEEDVFAALTRGLYEQFQRGEGVQAYGQAKDLAAKYPANDAIRQAEKKLWDALLADAKTIEVPEQRRSAATGGYRSGGAAGDMLAGIGRAPAAEADQGDPDLSVDVDTHIPHGRLKRPNAVAVVIGNGNYARQGRGIGDVDYAGRDAAVMKQYLEQVMGFDPDNIIYRRDVTGGDLRSIFGSKDRPRGKLHNYVRPDGTSEVFIYYVGHGAPGPRGNSAYLVPVDAEVDYIANNGYPLDLFYAVLKKLPARHLTVVLDACFSGDSGGGPLFKKISPAMLKNVQPVQKLAHSVIFSSAARDQVATWYPAKRHSLFTYFFLKGLGGAADKDGDKRITAGEMQAYLGREVPYRAQRETGRVQTPLVAGEAGAVLAQLR